MARIKLNNADDNSNDNIRTTSQVEDKDGYYKQDKDDDDNNNDKYTIFIYTVYILYTILYIYCIYTI